MASIIDCKRILFKIGIELGVSPNLIGSRLLDKQDKKDMENGLIPLETLVCAVKLWQQAGMPNYANGKCEPYREKPDLPMSRYRGKGKNAA